MLVLLFSLVPTAGGVGESGPPTAHTQAADAALPASHHAGAACVSTSWLVWSNVFVDVPAFLTDGIWHLALPLARRLPMLRA